MASAEGHVRFRNMAASTIGWLILGLMFLGFTTAMILSNHDDEYDNRQFARQHIAQLATTVERQAYARGLLESDFGQYDTTSGFGDDKLKNMLKSVVASGELPARNYTEHTFNRDILHTEFPGRFSVILLAIYCLYGWIVLWQIYLQASRVGMPPFIFTALPWTRPSSWPWLLPVFAVTFVNPVGAVAYLVSASRALADTLRRRKTSQTEA